MKTTPLPIRLGRDLQAALTDGARRTPHKKQELIRLTLRRHLRNVIEEEATIKDDKRITNVRPWNNRTLEKASKKMGKEWDVLESLAIRAQGAPNLND